jgi:hypothetical protein
VRAVLLVLAGCGRLGFDAGDEIDAPVPTCTGHDEDGDACPDDCDVCPTVGDPLQRDGDRDGVGDACDPRPAISGDYIIRFEPHTDSAAARYTNETGIVVWMQDAVHAGALDAGGALHFTLDAYPSRLAAGMHIIAASMQDQWFGYWYNQHPTAGDPKIFSSGMYTAPGPARFTLKDPDAAAQVRFCPDAADVPARFAAAERYTMVTDTALVTGGDHLINVSSSGGVLSCTLSIGVLQFNDGFLEAFRLFVDFDYFIVYGIR